MEEYKIKNQMASLTPAEQKEFINKLIKSAKTTKLVNDLTFMLKAGAYPMVIFGSATAFVGLTALAAGALNVPASVVADYRVPLMLVGVMGMASGASGIACAYSHCKDAKKEAKKARALSACAKKDIKMLKLMYKEVEKEEKMEQKQVQQQEQQEGMER